MSGFAISPHEECAVEEAVQITERLGGSVSVLTLGPPEAAEQLRDALALGAHRAVLLESGGREWGPIGTAAAIVAEARRHAEPARAMTCCCWATRRRTPATTRWASRVAHALGWPCVTGIKRLEITAGRARASREYHGSRETFELPLPAVISVKEGINLPRYPSLPGRLRAKRAVIEQYQPPWQPRACASSGSGCRRPSSTRPPCWVPDPARYPPWSGCWTSWGCCDDRANGARRRLDSAGGMGRRAGRNERRGKAASVKGDGEVGGAPEAHRGTVLCLVELDNAGPTDASLRALSFARTLAGPGGGRVRGAVRPGR